MSLAAYDRIHSGMTEAEVAALLGPPTADRTARPTPADIPAMPCGPVQLGRLLDYAGDKGTVTVYYNADGHLYHAWADLRPPTHSEWLRHNLRRW